MDALWQDFRYALRGIRGKPAFASAVVLTLALGIGANAAMFSIVDRLLLRPPPRMIHPELTHRVYFASRHRGKESAFQGAQYARYVDITSWTHTLARTAEFTSRKLAIGVGDDAREMQVGVVSSSFFGFFDAPPVLGRYFTFHEDSPPEGAPVAVLSYGMWKTRFAGRRDALGAQLQIGPTVYTVIGVAPPGFVGLWPDQPPVAFIPITSYAAADSRGMKNENWWTTYHWMFASMIVQRKPGVSVDAANADLTAAYVRSYEAQAVNSPGQTPAAIARPRAFAASILSERGPNPSPVARVATLVSAMALVVLLIACANVANLLLARALRRRREIAVRLALGVSRARLLSQLLTESVLLAILGGVAGVVIAQFGGALLRSVFLPPDAVSTVISDARTLLFVGAAALMTGLLTGLAPAWQSGRVELTHDLKASAREGTYHQSRTRAALLVFQGALSVVLLVGAGLFVRSLHNVQTMRLGYDADSVLMVNLNMRGVVLDSARAVALRRQLLSAAQNTAGVEHAALNTSIPFWSTWNVGLYVAGIDSVSRLGEFDLNAVTPDYFATMGTRIVRGRGIDARDVANAPGAMVVSEAMAKTLWPGKDPIGQCVRVNADTLPCTYVVGVAENIRSNSLNDDPQLYYYLAAEQFHPDRTGLFLRIRGNAAHQAEAIRHRLQALMPGASYVSVTPFSQVIGSQMRSWKIGATMFVAFGALALVLAAIGLYSVLAYNVAQRTHELGVRIALGARVSDVVGLVVSQGMRLGVAGVLIGGGIAWVGGRWVKPMLYDESPRDPLVFGLVAAILFVVALLATFLPARRAAAVDPSSALRAE